MKFIQAQLVPGSLTFGDNYSNWPALLNGEEIEQELRYASTVFERVKEQHVSLFSAKELYLLFKEDGPEALTSKYPTVEDFSHALMQFSMTYYRKNRMRVEGFDPKYPDLYILIEENDEDDTEEPRVTLARRVTVSGYAAFHEALCTEFGVLFPLQPFHITHYRSKANPRSIGVWSEREWQKCSAAITLDSVKKSG